MTQNIIFLGFDFHKWYFQLILHLLKISYDPCIRYAAAQSQLDRPLQTLYESHFKINFESQDLEGFVSELHRRFKPEQLRRAAPTAAKKRIFHRQNIVRFLAKAFNPTDFETFCLINFEKVHNEFTPTQGQSNRINLLMDYAARQEQFETLLEYAQQENPIQYRNFAPYYDDEP